MLKNGYTPLMVALLNGKLDAVHECGGADANLTTEVASYSLKEQYK